MPEVAIISYSIMSRGATISYFETYYNNSDHEYSTLEFKEVAGLMV